MTAKIFIRYAIPLFLISCKKDQKTACESRLCSIVKSKDTYNYPIKAGSPEWAAFTSHQQMEDACQIPSDTLSKMSTEGVMQSCLDFPLLGDLLLNVGVNVPGITDYYMSNFSGMIELSQRTDAGATMLERYKAMDPQCAHCMPVEYSTNFNAFEMIIANDSIIKSLSSSEKRRLVKEAIIKYKQKKTLPNYYALYGLSTSLYICTKVMAYEKYQPFVQLYNQSPEIQLFVLKLLWPSDTNKMNRMLEQIIEQANSFSN